VTIRPGAKWRRLFQRASEKPAVVDYALPATHEQTDPAEDAPDLARLNLLAFDPTSPAEGEMWGRTDKNPLELRVYAAGQTYAVALGAVAAEPLSPRYPSTSLYPAFYPRGIGATEPLRPRYPSRELYPPFYPRSLDG
jgi:hypothetical protein